MLTFYIIRHGNKEAIPFDPPLTGIGLKQAELTGKYFKNHRLKTIVASPKLRTQQTAKAISDHSGISVETDERLLERMEWEYGRTFEEFMAEWDKTVADRDFIPSNGDSSKNKGKKMRMVLEELAKKYKDGSIVIVTHGGAIGDLLRNLFNGIKLVNKQEPLTGANYSSFLECSVTTIQKRGDKFELIDVSDINHLLKLQLS